MTGFNAHEWLHGVMEAAEFLRDHERLASERREVATSLGSPVKEVMVSSTSSGDVMAPIDALIMADEARDRLVRAALAEVASARLAFAGMRSVGPNERTSADCLELRYVELWEYDRIAAALHVSRSTIRRRVDYGTDWLSAHGVAHAKAGLGGAEG